MDGGNSIQAGLKRNRIVTVWGGEEGVFWPPQRFLDLRRLAVLGSIFV